MTFGRKVFVAIFVSTLLVGSLLIWVSYSFFQSRSEEDFVNRYTSLTRILSDALSRLDVSTETLMRNAALVIADRDSAGLMSTDELRILRNKLGITHAFIVNSDGAFIRSTNEDPSKIPNLFSFSPNYRKLLTGESEVEATPVITPKPERTPFKFLSVASFDKKRIIEVGVRVDFIANTLAEAVKSDEGVQAMTLYSPDGSPFGTFSATGVTFETSKQNLPSELNVPLIGSDEAHFYSLVSSSHEQCSQCDIAKTSKAGKYFYVLESKVSKASLISAQHLAAEVAFIFLLINGFVSWIAATLISKRLVKNIRFAVARVREIGEGSPSTRVRVGLNDRSEISYLTREFDTLLDRLEVSQAEALHAKTMSSKIELAKVVAHNMKSPVIALEMTLPLIANVPDGVRRVIRSAVDEIKSLSLDLKKSSQGDNIGLSNLGIETFSLEDLLHELVDQKRIEFGNVNGFDLEISDEGKTQVRANKPAIRSVLSNVINNAVESYRGVFGKVEIALSKQDGNCNIEVRDSGAGIEPEMLAGLGVESISTKSGIGRGIGVVHAKSAVEASGGHLSYSSTVGRGTTVSISLPLAN